MTVWVSLIDNETIGVEFSSPRAIRRVAPEPETEVRIHVATDDTELVDLLDRILDKGLFLGSANLLTLGQANLSAPDTRISVSSLQTNTDSYARPLRPSRSPLRIPSRKR